MQGLVHQYGYAKVTMDDIAKASGLSRPALYQFFKNKQEIYRAIAEQVSSANLKQMEEILCGDQSPKERLVDAIVEGKLKMLAEMEATRHGAELLDLGNELSADIIETYASGMRAMFTQLFEEIIPEDSGLSPEVMAANLLYWLEGMKAQVKDPDERQKLLQDFVAMQFAAIEKS